MFHYQDVIARLRRNEGRRLIQAALRMGPRKIDEIRRLAIEMNWLNPETELLDIPLLPITHSCMPITDSYIADHSNADSPFLFLELVGVFLLEEQLYLVSPRRG